MRALTPSAGADLVPAEAHQSTHGAERVFLFCFFYPGKSWIYGCSLLEKRRSSGQHWWHHSQRVRCSCRDDLSVEVIHCVCVCVIFWLIGDKVCGWEPCSYEEKKGRFWKKNEFVRQYPVTAYI